MWVLIFDRQGSPGLSSPGCVQRGLYCLWSKGLNSAVAFQERDGALRYAFKLKARGLGVPGPTRVAMTVRVRAKRGEGGEHHEVHAVSGKNVCVRVFFPALTSAMCRDLLFSFRTTISSYMTSIACFPWVDVVCFSPVFHM